jgi:CheY-like chemotaxis protein
MFYAVTPRLGVPALAPCVLVVESEPTARCAMLRMLTLAGFRTLAAATLAAAYEHLPFQPDVVLTDLTLPDGSGLDLVRRLRHRREPVAIGVVTDASTAMLNAAAALRPDAIFAKPVDVTRVIDWLNDPTTTRI